MPIFKHVERIAILIFSPVIGLYIAQEASLPIAGKRSLELCRLRCAREGNYVAYVLHTSNEEYETLEAETETGVGT